MAVVLDPALWERVEAVLRRPEIVTIAVARSCKNDPTLADRASVDRRLI